MTLWELSPYPAGRDDIRTWATSLWKCALEGVYLFLFYPSEQRCLGLNQSPLTQNLLSHAFPSTRPLPAGVMMREGQVGAIAVCTVSLK